jgi:hypothetical protein
LDGFAVVPLHEVVKQVLGKFLDTVLKSGKAWSLGTERKKS